MKTFLQFLYEMAKPSERHGMMTFYHGTGDKEAAEIIKAGYLKGQDKQGKSALSPIKGHAYITPHIHYAQIYAIGGDMAGSEHAATRFKGEHAYVFGIEGKHLKDIHPDEDSVGEKLYDAHNGSHHPDTGQKIFKHSWLKDLGNHHLTQRQISKTKEGEYSVWAQAGKKLNKHMNDWQKHQLIDDGAHIAHNGPLPVSKAWRVHKSKFHLLKRDGSNFFDHAEEVPLKSLKESLSEAKITLYRGNSSYNKKGGPLGGKFHTTDKEWARQFTQSGQDHEISTHKIDEKHIMDKSDVYAGDDIEPHVREAKSKGYKAVKFNEGKGEPHSIYVFSK